MGRRTWFSDGKRAGIVDPNPLTRASPSHSQLVAVAPLRLVVAIEADDREFAPLDACDSWCQRFRRRDYVRHDGAGPLQVTLFPSVGVAARARCARCRPMPVAEQPTSSPVTPWSVAPAH